MPRNLTIALAALALAAACGGGSHTASKKAAGQDQGAVSAQDTATRIGCDQWTEDTDLELYVADSGDCTLHGTAITVYRFSSNDLRDKWISAAKEFGIGRYLVFDRGTVVSDDQSIADELAPTLGGDPRT